MNKYSNERLKAHDAFVELIRKKKILVPYKCYYDVCPDTNSSGRVKFLDTQKEISPYVTKRIEKYAIITTIKDRYTYQLSTLQNDGRKIISSNNATVAKYLTKKKRNLKEARVILLGDEEIKLIDEVISFFDPKTELEIHVTDIDGFFTYYYEGEKIKGSSKKTGDTKRISELIINNDSLNMPYYLVLPNHNMPESAIRPTIKSLRDAILKAIIKKFPLIGEEMKKDKILCDYLLQVYAPFVEDSHLVKFAKTKFIKKQII